MDNLFSTNLNVIQERWPYIANALSQASLESLDVLAEQNTLLINNIQLTSNYDRRAEAQLQCDKIPLTDTKAFVYGVGLGDVPICLLERENIISVVVCILNMDLLLHSLNALDHVTWLADPRLTLTTAPQLKDVFFPFVALPTELHFADDESAVLRDRVVVELNHEHAMLHHSHDDVKIQEDINANIPFIKSDSDVGDLFDSLNGIPVFIAAAGPTLSQNIDSLLSFKSQGRSFKIIALDAAVKPLLLQNIIPDIVVSIDVKAIQVFSDIDFSLLSQCQLVYFPRISSELIKLWKGERFCAYSQGEIYQSINKEYPRASLYSAGSVIHTATDLAICMGTKNVIFMGADFGFPGGKVYAEGQDYDFTQQYSNSEHWVFNGHGEKISTMLNYRAYLRDLERYIENTPYIKFYNTSLEGARILGTSLFDKDLFFK